MTTEATDAGELAIRYRRLDEIHHDPANAKDHDVAGISASIGRFGFIEIPVVDERTDRLLAGHGRHETLTEAYRTTPAQPPRGVKVDDDGMWLVPTVAGVASADDHEAAAMGIALNRLVEAGGWDRDKLRTALEELNTDTPAGLTGTGFDLADLDQLIIDLQTPVREQGNRDPGDDGVDIAPPERPFSKRGDLWLLGEHRLLVGDATNEAEVDALFAGADPTDELLPHAGLVFTDPPYGVSYSDSKGRSIDGDELRRDGLFGLLAPAFTLAARHATETAAFYIWHASSTRRDFEDAMRAAGLEERQYLIWVKPSIVPGRSHYRWAHEPCFYAGKDGVTPAWYGDRAQPTTWRIAVATEGSGRAVALGPGVILTDGGGAELYLSAKPPKRKLRSVRVGLEETITITVDGPGDAWEVARDTSPTGNPAIHPNQKPVELARRALINSTKPGDIVYDPFLGSGTTIIGADQLGRRCFGLELDPPYADLILARWTRHADEAPVRAGDGEPFPGLG